MDIKAIAKQLNNRSGQFFGITMKRDAKVKKGVTEVVEKMTVMTGQLCEYSKRAPVKNAVAEGERDAPELPSHISHSFMEGDVRFWQGKNGSVYLPMPLAGNKSKVTWFLGGEQVTYAEVEPFLLAADKPRESKSKEELAEIGQAPFVGINIENILEVH